MAKVASNYPLENFPRCNSWGKYQKHGQNPLPSSMEHFSEIYGTVHNPILGPYKSNLAPYNQILAPFNPILGPYYSILAP